MSYIGNTPGVSSQRVVLEQVVTGSPQSAFTPVGGYTLGYVDVLVNGTEIDSSDFTASDGVTVTLATAAAVGDTVKIKTWLPRGLSDGYLKTEADARYVAKAGSTMTGNLYLPGLSLGTNSNSQNIAFTANSGNASGGTSILAWGKDMASWGGDIHYISDSRGAGGGHRFFKWDGTTWTQQALIDSNNNLNLNAGNLVLASGKGIDFSAGSNASGMTGELLNDYEEGTWTPYWTAQGGGSIATYGRQTGQYVKVGKWVFATCHIINAGTNTLSGALFLAGLPFTSSSGGWQAAYLHTELVSLAASAWIWGHIAPSTSTVGIRYWANASSAGSLSGSNLQTNSDIMVSVMYMAS